MRDAEIGERVERQHRLPGVAAEAVEVVEDDGLEVGLIRFRGHLPKGGYDVPTWRHTQAPAPRRQFTDEFKAEAVRLVLDEGKTVGSVARDLDLTESALREWVEARARRSHPGQDRPDDRGARGAGAAAQGESRAADGARHPKKSRGLLREASSGEVRLHRGGEGRTTRVTMLCRLSAGLAAAASTPGSERPESRARAARSRS